MNMIKINVLYSSRGNQINIAQVTILQVLFTNQINSNVGFLNQSDCLKNQNQWVSIY